jgi:thiol-disulfide isomerase/thioredoxin
MLKNLEYENMTIGTFSTGLHVLFFYLDGCGPCKEIYPHVEDLSELYTDVGFHKLIFSSFEQNFIMLADSMDVVSYPTIAVIFNGEIVTTIINNKNIIKSVEKLIQYFQN